MATIVLLTLSNLFMTIAWYGHLRFRTVSLPAAILGSWLIALPEYALQVPANRLGYGPVSAYQLKILQEAITLIVFVAFAWGTLGEAPTLRSLLAFGLVFAGVAVVFGK